MKRTAFLSIAALSIALTGPALAQDIITEGHLADVDQNGDGIVSEAEYVAHMDGIFEVLDEDNSGWISYAELEILLDEDERANIDPNRDGRITKAEYDAQMARDFELADQDGNGVLN
jgi:hypothetical protein